MGVVRKVVLRYSTDLNNTYTYVKMYPDIKIRKRFYIKLPEFHYTWSVTLSGGKVSYSNRDRNDIPITYDNNLGTRSHILQRCSDFTFPHKSLRESFSSVKNI